MGRTPPRRQLFERSSVGHGVARGWSPDHSDVRATIRWWPRPTAPGTAPSPRAWIVRHRPCAAGSAAPTPSGCTSKACSRGRRSGSADSTGPAAHPARVGDVGVLFVCRQPGFPNGEELTCPPAVESPVPWDRHGSGPAGGACPVRVSGRATGLPAGWCGRGLGCAGATWTYPPPR